MTPLRVAVIGAGAFGRNHVRAISSLSGMELAGIVDPDRERAARLAAEFGSSAFQSLDEIMRGIDAAIVAAPTQVHEELASRLLLAGIDVLIEKPIALTSEAGARLTDLAASQNRVLQVGHLERFNPAVTALQKALTIPLFFEVHRLSLFTPRSLDVDVVLDLMIHDLDIVLQFTHEEPVEVRAAGISVLSQKVDIANVRLAFPSGCIANLTASRVSTEQVRKLRLFQPGEYVSLDYSRQEAARLCVNRPGSQEQAKVDFQPLAVEKAEPLLLELASFFQAVRHRTRPLVDGRQATDALRLAEQILVKIGQHAELVAQTTQRLSK